MKSNSKFSLWTVLFSMLLIFAVSSVMAGEKPSTVSGDCCVKNDTRQCEPNPQCKSFSGCNTATGMSTNKDPNCSKMDRKCMTKAGKDGKTCQKNSKQCNKSASCNPGNCKPDACKTSCGTGMSSGKCAIGSKSAKHVELAVVK